MVWNMKCWNIHRKDKYLVLLLIISNIFNLISDTMSYSKPEQMNDQEFYISVLQVKCLSKFRHLNGSNQSHVQKRVRIKKFWNWQEKTSTLVLIFGLAFMESAKSVETFFPASIFLFDNWPKTIHKVLAPTLFFFQGQTAALPCRVQAVPPPTLRYRIKKHFSFQNSKDSPRFN